MQVRGKLGDKPAEIFLAFLGNFFKINHQAGVMILRKVFDGLIGKVLARAGVFQHGRHFIGQPVGAVGIVEQRHGGNFDGRILLLQGLQPRGQLGIGFHVQRPLAVMECRRSGMSKSISRKCCCRAASEVGSQLT